MPPIRETVMLVTGSTNGIGRITAQRLAQMGAGVILHGRDPEKCRSVRDAIWKISGNPKLDFVVADFSSLADVRHMAAGVAETHDHLDVLINNAGAVPRWSNEEDHPRSAQGYDLCLAVNFLAPFLLTHLLLPVMRKSTAGRIVNICQPIEEPIDLDDPMIAVGYSPESACARSYFALALFSMELGERLARDGITVNCVQPGAAPAPDTPRHFYPPGPQRADAAEVPVYFATAAEMAGVSGGFFIRTEPARGPAQAYEPDLRRQVWRLAARLTHLAAEFAI